MRKQEKDKSFQENSRKFLDNSNPNILRKIMVLGCPLFSKSRVFQCYMVDQIE